MRVILPIIYQTRFSFAVKKYFISSHYDNKIIVLIQNQFGTKLPNIFQTIFNLLLLVIDEEEYQYSTLLTLFQHIYFLIIE